MDESLTEFQEKKTNNTGPKNIQKPIVNKNKSKKPLKRIKGQKDIRTILKKKKNELISYAKDFDDICKQSGVDVDPEQLQLAIALSKSLQQTESTSDGNTQHSSKPGSQERALKIRTTLQQYGFKVPEIKITTTGSRKTKKYRKHYKLISISDTERNQIISDKYSQLLLENLNNNNITKTDTNVDVTKLRLFHLASSTAYDSMKDIDNFYVDNLFEKSKSTSCLLKNWSDIPGRPESPKIIKDNSMVFSEIECSQDELDVILSGSLKMAKTIFKSKSACIYNECDKIENIDDGVATKIDDNSVLVIKHDVCVKALVNKSDVVSNDIIIENDIEVLDIGPKSLTVTQQCRSCSPDIFDDELSVVDSSITTALKSQDLKTVEESNNFMDLTECVNIKNSRVENSQEPNSQLSQKSDITKRKSCDFMEITECIVSSSQPILLNYENIDLTQSPEHHDEVVKDNVDKIESMDLTQSSNTSDELPFVEIDGQLQKSLDDTVILNDNEYFNINNKLTNPDFEKLELDNVEIDLTKGKYASPEKSLDNFNDHSNKRKEMSQSDINDEDILTKPNNDLIKEINDIDLTQSSNSEEIDKNANSLTTTPKILCNYTSLDKNYDKSMDYDELFDSIDKREISPVKSLDNNNDHTNKRKEMPQSDIHYGDLITKSNNDFITDIIDIDLTQSSNSEDIYKNANSLTTTPKILCNNSSLDKNDDKSIDYDELFDSLDKRTISGVNTPNKSLFIKSSNSNDKTNENIKINNSLNNTSNCTASDLSQNSRVFEIVDQEFDYSLHKSRLNISMENFDDHIEEIEFRNSIDDIASSSSRSPERIQIPPHKLDYLHNIPDDNFALGGISILNNFSNLPSFRKTINAKQSIANNLEEDMNDSYLPVIDLKKSNNNTDTQLQKEVAMQTPIKEINKNILFKTPTNKDYIIKTDDVTPMLDYASMSTPERNKELEKYGLKPFKRKRAIKLLTHLYNQTHPIVETYENEDLPSPSKKPKHSRNKSTENSPKNTLRSPRKTSEVNDDGETQVVYEESNPLPNIMKIDCDEDDWIFQKREKAKVHSCRVPLHIAFYNYVFSRRGLREAILRYDPVNIDVIHKDLVGYGHRYDPKDLLKFMDKMCITVKTTDNNSRNNKR